MTYIIVGLGNPGEEYEHTRHNIGRLAVDAFARANDLSLWDEDKNAHAHYVRGAIGKHKVELLLPDTFMNKSGSAVLYAKTKHKCKPENIIVVHDDIDLPFGKMRISIGRGSGGHRGVDSIAHSLKTKDFVRIRIGVSPTTAKGLARKPGGEEKVLAFLMGNFRKPEMDALKKVFKTVNEALKTILADGHTKAMNTFNGA